MSSIERLDQEVVDPKDVIYEGQKIGDASEKDAVSWAYTEARTRTAALVNKYPGYAEEGARALGYLDLAESIIQHLPHRTYGDYGHTA